MKSELILFKALYRKYSIELRRYYFNTISLLISIYLIFMFIFYSTKSIQGANSGFGETSAGILVGFMIWFLAIFTYSELSFVLVQEASQGTLEQLAMSPLGFRKVIFIRTIVALLFNLLIMAIFLLLMMMSTGEWLHLDVLSIVPLVLITIVGVLGLSLVVGGLALLFKQIQSSLQILQFVFVLLISPIVDYVPFIKILPLAWGTRLVGRVMIDGISLAQIPVQDLLILIASSIFYFLVGYLIFRFCENKARDYGLLGHY